MTELIPLAEFDPDPTAMIDPKTHHMDASNPTRVKMPAAVVACFFGDVVARIASEHSAERVARLAAEHGEHPIYGLERHGRRFAFYQAGLGAPLAAGLLEETIGYGATTVVACGGAGALDAELALGHVVVVSSALRDEGTSFHYQPPARSIDADPAVVATLSEFLRERGVPHVEGKTWTTDAFFRETKAKVANRRAEGCITVEMEASALIAVARWRGICFGHLLYAGDSLAADKWDHRGWNTAHDVREQLFWLAADAALLLAGPPPGG
jgi:uridine phosphorylase